jgi:hypothetical protein
MHAQVHMQHGLNKLDILDERSLPSSETTTVRCRSGSCVARQCSCCASQCCASSAAGRLRMAPSTCALKCITLTDKQCSMLAERMMQLPKCKLNDMLEGSTFLE